MRYRLIITIAAPSFLIASRDRHTILLVSPIYTSLTRNLHTLVRFAADDAGPQPHTRPTNSDRSTAQKDHISGHDKAF